MTTLADLGLSAFKVNLIAFLCFLLTAAALLLAAFLFYLRAIGSYKIAKRLSLVHPWYSFIPFVRSYHLGYISDQCKNRHGNTARSLSRLLLWLRIASVFMCCALLLTIVKDTVELVFAIDTTLLNGEDFLPSADCFSNLVPLFLVALATEVAFKVVHYIALGRVYAVFFKGGMAARLVLSIVFPFLEPVFIYTASKNHIHKRHHSSQINQEYYYGDL